MDAGESSKPLVVVDHQECSMCALNVPDFAAVSRMEIARDPGEMGSNKIALQLFKFHSMRN